MTKSDESWEAPAVPSEVRPVRAFVRQYAADAGLADQHASEAVLAVWEAVANVCMHAFTDRRAGWVTVTLSVDETDMVAVISDDGVGMRTRPDSPGAGVGLKLIDALADRFTVESDRDGTEVTLRFSVR